MEVAEDVNAEDEESEEEDALAVSAARAQPSSEQTLTKKPVVWNEVGKVVDDGMTSYRSTLYFEPLKDFSARIALY